MYIIQTLNTCSTKIHWVIGVKLFMKTALKKNTNMPNMSKKNLYIIIAAALVIVAAAVLVTILLLNSGKNVKDLYFQTEIKNFIKLMSDAEKRQNDKALEMKPFLEKPSRTRLELSAKLPHGSSSNVSVSSGGNSGYGYGDLPGQAIDIINSSKLVLNSRYNLKEGLNASTLSFLLEGQSFLDINTFSENDTIGLQVPVIYDKYFVLDRNNLPSALKKFGVDMPVKKIFNVSEIKNAATFSLEASKNIFTDYLKFLEENIQEGNISMSKNVKMKEMSYQTGTNASTDINASNNNSSTSGTISQEPGKSASKANKESRYNIFNVKLDEEEFKTISKKTVEVFLSDSRFVNMTMGNLTSVFSMLEEAGYLNIFPSLKPAAAEILNYRDTEKLKTELINIIDTTAFPEGFNMTLVVDAVGNFTDRKINLSSKADDEPARKYSIHAGRFFTKAIIEQESSVSGNAGSTDDKAVIEFEHVKGSNPGDTYMHLNCVNNIWPDFDLTVNSSTESSKDDKRKAINTNCRVNMRLTASQLGFDNANILLDLKREDRYDIDLNIPELNNESAINLTTADENQVNALVMELQFSAAKFLLSNQSILNAFSSDN